MRVMIFFMISNFLAENYCISSIEVYVKQAPEMLKKYYFTNTFSLFYSRGFVLTNIFPDDDGGDNDQIRLPY